jgi:hypothetical protein
MGFAQFRYASLRSTCLLTSGWAREKQMNFIIDVEPVDGFKLALAFKDGFEGMVDLEELFKKEPCRVGNILSLPTIHNQEKSMEFEIIGEIKNVETFATGSSIRELPRLRRIYGDARWRKRKGIAEIRLPDNTTRLAELHWYEASGIGKKEFKIKRYLD